MRPIAKSKNKMESVILRVRKITVNNNDNDIDNDNAESVFLVRDSW